MWNKLSILIRDFSLTVKWITKDNILDVTQQVATPVKFMGGRIHFIPQNWSYLLLISQVSITSMVWAYSFISTNERRRNLLGGSCMKEVSFSNSLDPKCPSKEYKWQVWSQPLFATDSGRTFKRWGLVGKTVEEGSCLEGSIEMLAPPLFVLIGLHEVDSFVPRGFTAMIVFLVTADTQQWSQLTLGWNLQPMGRTKFVCITAMLWTSCQWWKCNKLHS